MGCSGTRRDRSAVRSGKRRACEAVEHARRERVVVEVAPRGDRGGEGLEMDEERVRLRRGLRLVEKGRNFIGRWRRRGVTAVAGIGNDGWRRDSRVYITTF
jgi:hypothetical protein